MAGAIESEPAEDPFASFTDFVGGDIRDPYRDIFLEKRRRDPVWKGDLVLGGAEIPGVDAAEQYTVFRFDDCERVLKDPGAFTSTFYDDTIGLVMGRTMLGMDDPEHRRHRSLVAHAFRQKALARWENELIGSVVHELIDGFAGRERAELVQELTFRFPVRVIARLLGLPEEDFAQFQRWSVELIGLAADFERGIAASQALRDYFAGVVDDRRRDPRDDVISDLVTAEVDGERLDDEAIYSFLRLLLPAGAETTFRSSGNLLMLLLTHPDQLEAVRDDRSLIPQTVEEGLRCEPPLLIIARSTTRDTELRGVTIPEGAGVGVCIGSANHDEERWEDPERFDIFREPQQHLAFAMGPHMCLGMHLARIETRVLLDAVLDRLPNLRLDPDADDPHVRGLIFRSPNQVPVVFDPA